MKVDDKVTPIKYIVEHDSENGMGVSTLAKPGEVLVIRQFTGKNNGYIYVSHETRTDGMTFWVTADEVKPYEG